MLFCFLFLSSSTPPSLTPWLHSSCFLYLPSFLYFLLNSSISSYSLFFQQFSLYLPNHFLHSSFLSHFLSFFLLASLPFYLPSFLLSSFIAVMDYTYHPVSILPALGAHCTVKTKMIYIKCVIYPFDFFHSWTLERLNILSKVRQIWLWLTWSSHSTAMAHWGLILPVLSRASNRCWNIAEFSTLDISDSRLASSSNDKSDRNVPTYISHFHAISFCNRLSLSC